MENPIKKDDLGVPLLLETPTYESAKFMSSKIVIGSTLRAGNRYSHVSSQVHKVEHYKTPRFTMLAHTAPYSYITKLNLYNHQQSIYIVERNT